MGKDSEISWTDHTFNTVWGCKKFDALCKNCYAEALDKRWHNLKAHWGKKAERKIMSPAYWKQPLTWNKEAFDNNRMDKVFCSSMADWAENHPTLAQERLKLFPLTKITPNLWWLLLSKRYNYISKALPEDWGNGYDNVWLGQSVGKQALAEKYLDTFLKNKAKVLFLSAEPLLGPMDLKPWLKTGKINWVIVGGESGNFTGKYKCRPCKIEWMEQIVADCKQYNVPVFVKQLGSYIARERKLNKKKGTDMSEFPDSLKIREFPLITQAHNVTN